jgi:SpoVK/Ycf46/Vps4 family AAA+-type ATPase
MKNIFLLAKFIAIQSDAEKIEFNHLQKALSSVEIVDTNIKDILDQISETNSSNIYFTNENISTALKAPQMNFSNEVEQIKDLLENKGFTFNKVISKLSFKKTKSTVLDFIRNIKQELSEILYEQENAIEAISDSLMRSHYIQDKNKPKAVFLFTGDVGSGKSFAAKTFADLMESEGYLYKSFNMGSYTSDNESFVLNGLSKGYNGAREGELTKFVKENKKSIILFDSIDKAHNNVLNTLNEILDNGSMLDNYTTNKVDFSDTILIFETNAGKEIFLKPEFNEIVKEDSFLSEAMIMDSISKEMVSGYKNLFVLPREFISRIMDASIVLFNKLTFDSSVEILKKQLLKEQSLIEKNFGLDIEFKNISDTTKLLVLSSGPDFAIRKILKKGPFLLFDSITDFLLENNIDDKRIIIGIDNSFNEEYLSLLDGQNDNKLLHNLFRKNKAGKFKVDIKLQEDSVSVNLISFKIDTVKRAADYGGDTGLIIEVPDDGFDMIAGHDKVKERLSEIIEILNSKELKKEYAEFISKGMLLYGPPGTGKTMLAKAFAKEADMPFIATTGPDLLSENALNEVFTKAREYAPSIIFIDEIDVFKHRGQGYQTDIIINKILTQIEGFSSKEENRIFIVAATNLKSEIDGAILRSGRIDLHVEIPTLDKIARSFFVTKFIKSDKFDNNINIDKIIKMTAGFSGADLKKLERESVLDAFRKDISTINEEFLINHINILKFGELIENSTAIEDVLKQTAYHEAGHAIVSKILFPNKSIEQITIAPRKKSLGFVAYEFKEDVQHDIDELKNIICVALGGRIAESKQFNNQGINSGASSDLDKAIQIAYTMVAEYGMIDNIKSTYFDKLKTTLFADKCEQQMSELIKSMTKETEKS